MPWTDQRYPAAMQNLPVAVRQKAIEIANALLDEGMDDGRAIRIAIAGARRWAAHHSLGLEHGRPHRPRASAGPTG